MAAAALTFAACSNENDIVENAPVAAQVNAGISDLALTRAAGTAWNEGDQIGVSTVGEGNTKYPNVLYTISDASKGSFTSAAPVYFQDTNPVTFSAYYPYTADGGTVEKTIAAADQEADAQKKIDYLFASGATANKDNPTVSFTKQGDKDYSFHHKMVKLDFTFKKGADTDLKDMTDFTVGGLKLAGTFNTTNGEAKVTDDAVATDLKIKETPTESDTYYRSLILFPQAVEGKSFNISLTLGGQTYKATLLLPDGKAEFESGYKYAYTITVNKTALSVLQAEISDWSNGGSNVDGNATLQ